MMEPFLCTKNHNDLQTFCDKVFIDYFQKNMRLYAVKCVICKTMIMPEKNTPVLICTNATRGCKYGYCLDHKAVFLNTGNKRRKRSCRA
eukprot:10194206-Ditylum_brightwellii.AAC.1